MHQALSAGGRVVNKTDNTCLHGAYNLWVRQTYKRNKWFLYEVISATVKVIGSVGCNFTGIVRKGLNEKVTWMQKLEQVKEGGVQRSWWRAFQAGWITRAVSWEGSRSQRRQGSQGDGGPWVIGRGAAWEVSDDGLKSSFSVCVKSSVGTGSKSLI